MKIINIKNIFISLLIKKCLHTFKCIPIIEQLENNFIGLVSNETVVLCLWGSGHKVLVARFIHKRKKKTRKLPLKPGDGQSQHYPVKKVGKSLNHP